MRTIFFSIALGLLPICFGCSNRNIQEESDNKKFSLDDFDKVELAGADVDLTPDCDFIGTVKELRVVNDSIIAISQGRSENNVILYNLNSGKWQVANRRGLGPLEILNVGSMSIDANGRLLLSGIYEGKLISVAWNDNGDEAEMVLLASPSESCMKIIAGNGTDYICLAAPTWRSRLIVLDSIGNVVDSLGTFPDVELPDSLYPNNFYFQSDLAYSRGENKVAVVNKSWNEIGIHPLDHSKGDIILSGPVFPELSLKKFGDDSSFGFAPYPLWFMFSGASANETGFAVGFVGVEAKTESDLDRHIGSILEFDWDGNPRRRFILPAEATAFDIDYSNNAIYTIENRPDPTLVKYSIANK